MDEQDCWLRPDLVPKLVKIVHDAGKALGFQVLMISHHDVAIFEQYADRIYQCVPVGNGRVEVRLVGSCQRRPTPPIEAAQPCAPVSGRACAVRRAELSFAPCKRGR